MPEPILNPAGVQVGWDLSDVDANEVLGGMTPDLVAGPPCAKCGQPMPPITPEMASMMRAQGATIAHEVCPGETPPQPEGRYFEVRVSVVEVTERQTNPPFPDETVPEATELVRFTAGHRAPNLAEAMRPLALALGERWAEAEKRAPIADTP
jgi:hypothetical protein